MTPRPDAATDRGGVDARLFELRWARGERDLADALGRLQGAECDPLGQTRDLLGQTRDLLRRSWAERPADLRDLDLKGDLRPDWFLDERMVGYVFYADRFAGRLSGLPKRVPYLAGLGVTYANVMHCRKPPRTTATAATL